MSQVANKLKPALILDDSPTDVIPIARSLRLFAGVDVEYLQSIPAWERKHEITFDYSKKGAHDRFYRQIANQLKQYSALVVDNNFQNAGYPDDGVEGLPFLMGPIGSALKLIKPKERPLVVCFAPSSTDLIQEKKAELWRDHQIISFHKFYEAPFIGIAVKLANDNKVTINRENLLHDIFGFDPEEIDYNSPAGQFGFKLRYDLLDDDNVFGRDKVEGSALSFDWPNFLRDLASRLNTTENEFLGRIDSVVSPLRQSREGGGIPPQYMK
jgi:hypothetical protein